MWIQQSLEQSETYKHRGDLRLGQPRYTPKIPRRSSLQMGQEKGMETENPKAFVSATVVSLKSVLRGVLLEDSKFCPPCPSFWWLIFCQVICDVDVVGGSIPLHGRQEYQGRSTFGLSRVTLAAPKPMPVLESSLALATFFRPTCGLSFGFSWRFRSNKRCSISAASLIANRIPDGCLAKKDGKLRMPECKSQWDADCAVRQRLRRQTPSRMLLDALMSYIQPTGVGRIITELVS
jgi:hypothetical protein